MSRYLITLAALCACLLFAEAATAQDAVALAAPPVHAGTYDPVTGTLLPGSQPDEDVLYDNTADNGSFFVPGKGFIEMDWGTPAYGGNGAVLTGYQIGYATTRTTGQLAMIIRLHEGATGHGEFGTVIYEETLRGLPLSTGGAQGFTVDVLLGEPLDVLDGAVGWSYEFNDDETGPLLVGPPNAAGVENAWDEYASPKNEYVGTFWFGGTPYASFHLQLTGTANPPTPSAWLKYGVANGMVLSGFGPGTPGSENLLRIKGIGDTFAVLTVGLTQSDITAGANGITFYGWPWLFAIYDIYIEYVPMSLGVAELPAIIPIETPEGLQIYMQAIGQGLDGVYKRYSKGLELTVQPL
jgi:hypothetical protein